MEIQVVQQFKTQRMKSGNQIQTLIGTVCIHFIRKPFSSFFSRDKVNSSIIGAL